MTLWQLQEAKNQLSEVVRLEIRIDGRLVMKEWGKLCAQQELKGKRLPVLDSIIAATAIAHGHTLVTRNTKDYPSAVRLFNPWEC